MTDNSGDSSAARAQRGADEMGTTEDDEREQEKRFEETGEVPKDKLGNQDGAS